MASFSLYRLVNFDRQHKPATKFVFQLKQKIKFTKLNLTIDITIVPPYKFAECF